MKKLIFLFLLLIALFAVTAYVNVSNCTDLKTQLLASNDILLTGNINCYGIDFGNWYASGVWGNEYYQEKTIEGQNYTISNIYIDGNFNSEIGLIPKMNQSTIQNVRFENFVIENAGSNSGLLVGVTNASTSSGTNNFYNIHIVDSSISGNGSKLGGFIGFATEGIVNIEESSFSGTVNSTNTTVGGFIGEVLTTRNANIKESFTLGNIEALEYVGGLIGAAHKLGSISYQTFHSVIRNSFTRASIYSPGIHHSGFLGYSYNDAGFFQIVNSYFAANMPEGTNYAVVGPRSTNYAASSTYFDLNTSKTSLGSPGGNYQGTPKNTSDMIQQSTYSGWDFSTIWQIDNGISYPNLDRFVIPPSPCTENVCGGATDIQTEGISSAQIYINGELFSAGTFTGVQNIAINDGEVDVVNFDFNFSDKALDLENLVIERSSTGLLMKGLNLSSGLTKTLITPIKFGDICIKDAEVNNLSEVSQDCTDANEVLFFENECLLGITKNLDGNNYTCSLDPNGYYKISGLSHSAVTQQGTRLDENYYVNGYPNNINGQIVILDSVTFTANYTNSTDNSTITPALNGDCNISIEGVGLNIDMVYNSTNKLYEYTEVFSSASTYDYNITCDAPDFSFIQINTSIIVQNIISQIPEFSDFALAILLIGSVCIAGFVRTRNP